VSTKITDVAVDDELRTSFLSYAMSVIVSRALPDVRDGLKPVHRRILYAMAQMGLRPDRPYVKSSRVVGETMGKYHPHGDAAIYDALVRLAQDWSLRVPLVDGHGNFGTVTDGPAAARYTEARMARAALPMTAELDEDTVDFVPTYDGSGLQPAVLPSALPNLLVNGAEGIAVGMATKMPPHNLVEVIAACTHLLDHPDATVDDLLVHVKGPDLPTGGIVLGLDGLDAAYRTGRGSFTIRATTHVEDVSARRKGIVVTELPYQVGPEHIIDDIKKQRDAKRLAGVANVADYTDRKTGTRLVIECKTGFSPQAVLDELLRLTRLQVNFHVHNLALVDGHPMTLNLLELVTHYVDHRLEVTTRRCRHRKAKAEARAHLLRGYLTALAHIDEVVAVIKTSADTATARTTLMGRFELTDVQANAILEMPLRRLTGLEVTKIREELAGLEATIAELEGYLSDPAAMRGLVRDELQVVAREFGTPRRSQISTANPTVAPVDEAEARIPLAPCEVTVSVTGLIGAWPVPLQGARGRHDTLRVRVSTDTHATLGALTSTGRWVHVPVLELPTGGKDRGAAVREVLDLADGEDVVTLVPLDRVPPLAIGTRAGVVKVLNPDDLPKKSGQSVIGLKDGDVVVGAGPVAGPDTDLVFVTSDAQLLRTPAGQVRPQGRTGGGVAGIKLADGAEVIAFAAVGAGEPADVVTVAGGPGAATAAKVTALADYPHKGRATGGVRAHRLLRGQDRLVCAGVGADLVGATANGATVALPGERVKRDSSGTPTPSPVAAVAWRR
jgi:DNA gyrase subunit A